MKSFRIHTFFRTLIALIILLLSNQVHSASRFVDIDKELREANFVGEIVFVGYDSIKVPRFSEIFQAVKVDSITGETVRIHKDDSVWVISNIYFKKIGHSTDSIYTVGLYFNHSFSTYLSRSKASESERVSNGYWPSINDSCLIVINSSNEVSLFAEIHSDKYVFWDPYSNFGGLTVFAFDAPFEAFAQKGKKKLPSGKAGFVAEFLKKESDSFFYCAISKLDFKNVYEN